MKEFHARVAAITGDEWCPYPNQRFINAFMQADDALAKRMVEERRKHLFPAFLAPVDPCEDLIQEALREP